MKKFIYILLAASFLFACGGKNTDKNLFEDEELKKAELREQLYNEVMAVHDEVMPRMDDIYRLKIKLQEQLKELLEKSSDQHTDEIVILTEKIKALEEAGNSMMVWMRQFDVKPDSLGHEAIMRGLEEEMEKIKKVKHDMLEAIELAR